MQMCGALLDPSEGQRSPTLPSGILPPPPPNVSRNSLQHDLFCAASVSHAATAGSPPTPPSSCDVVVHNMMSFFQ